jgi:hypothetical protein
VQVAIASADALVEQVFGAVVEEGDRSGVEEHSPFGIEPGGRVHAEVDTYALKTRNDK